MMTETATMQAFLIDTARANGLGTRYVVIGSRIATMMRKASNEQRHQLLVIWWEYLALQREMR